MFIKVVGSVFSVVLRRDILVSLRVISVVRVFVLKSISSDIFVLMVITFFIASLSCTLMKFGLL